MDCTMNNSSLVIRMGGESGEGIVTIGEVFVRIAARAGLEVFTFRTYPAEIMGGHVIYQARIGRQRVLSDGDEINALVALNQEGYDNHIAELVPHGALVYDRSEVDPPDDGRHRHYPIPVTDISRELDFPRGRNLIMVGALTALFGLPIAKGEEVVKDKLGKYQSLLPNNLESLARGYHYVKENYTDLPPQIEPPAEPLGERLIMTGNEAAALGALAAGCRFFAGYPITPASGLMDYLADHMPGLGGKVIQTEDEISAITMATGASFAGAKAMTATSGPGFALMIEALGHASMTETPIVLVDVQRAGPSTGMPTKTAQGDLYMALYAGNDEAPRFVLAPDSVEDCFHQMINAFNLAEEFQMPVIVLSDQALSARVETIPDFDLSAVKLVERLKPEPGEDGDYRRYELTPSGVSPMALPGMPGLFYTAEGLEHNEKGNPNYTPEMHRAMTEKRHRKVDSARQVIQRLPVSDRWGDPLAEIGIISWGSTKGAVREAMERITAANIRVEAFFTRSLLPMPDALIRAFLQNKRAVIVPELNYRGMFARVIEHRYSREIVENGIRVVHLPKYDGLPFRPVDICHAVHRVAAELAGGIIRDWEPGC
jgi:2-oxoglutarate/2-oxoacid ferredoxin oxidoreductase subunit alpha